MPEKTEYRKKTPLTDMVSWVKDRFNGFTSQVPIITPLEPVQTIVPTDSKTFKPFQYQYPYGFNQLVNPRGTESITFTELRNFADTYDILRICIEKRKRSMKSLEWDIVATEEGQGGGLDDEMTYIKKFFQKPDRINSWVDWLNQLLEESLVIDALTLYPRKTVGGDMFAINIIDGATIKPLVDVFGYTPLPPLPAYIQIIQGMPYKQLTLDDISYLPLNKRVNTVYGFSPVEYIVYTVNIALGRQLSNLNYYSEGNIPYGFFIVAFVIIGNSSTKVCSI